MYPINIMSVCIFLCIIYLPLEWKGFTKTAENKSVTPLLQWQRQALVLTSAWKSSSTSSAVTQGYGPTSWFWWPQSEPWRCTEEAQRYVVEQFVLCAPPTIRVLSLLLMKPPPALHIFSLSSSAQSPPGLWFIMLLYNNYFTITITYNNLNYITVTCKNYNHITITNPFV